MGLVEECIPWLNKWEMLSESVFDFFISYRTLHVLQYANTHINLQMGYLMYSVSLDLFAHRILFFFF